MDHGLSAEKLGHAPRDAVRIEAELRVETARIARLAEGRGADVLERRGLILHGHHVAGLGGRPGWPDPACVSIRMTWTRQARAIAGSRGSATGVLDVGDGV